MCLQINPYKHKTRFPWQCKYKPKIAKKDIICYKHMVIAHDKVYSRFCYANNIYYGNNWEFNKVYKTKMKYDYNKSPNLMVAQGFHAFFDMGPNIEVVIPKGSKYFIGVNEDIVSNKIKIVKQLKSE